MHTIHNVHEVSIICFHFQLYISDTISSSQKDVFYTYVSEPKDIPISSNSINENTLQAEPLGSISFLQFLNSQTDISQKGTKKQLQ